MKRTLYIAALLAIPSVSADDITLNGGVVNYEGKNVTNSNRNGVVKGAALNSEGTVTITGAESVNFSGNVTKNSYSSSHDYKIVPNDLAVGGAIYGGTVKINSNSGNISFASNELRALSSNDFRLRVRGGAVKGSTVEISGNTGQQISFTGNAAYDEYKAWDDTAGTQVDKPKFSCGGAVYADNNLSIIGNSGVDISFSNNKAGKGGAIAAGYQSTMLLSGNGKLSFTSNIAENGGAAYTGAPIYQNGSKTGYGTLTIAENTGVTFTGNQARNNGGAIYVQTYSSLSVSENKGDVLFERNTAATYGGAIRGQSSSSVELNDNTGNVTFNNNSITKNDKVNIYGGAISVDSNSQVNLNNNRSVNLTNNTLYSQSGVYGGAIAIYNSTLNIKENDQGGSISGNIIESNNTSTSDTAAQGGAVYGKTIRIENNEGSFKIQNNVAKTTKGTAKGGAFYTTDTLSISGNQSVEFRGNVQQDSTTGTILRSVYLESNSATGSLNLSAAKGGSITFYDSLYATKKESAGLTVDFNTGEGNTGTIIFSGKHIVEDLLDIKADASDAEIMASFTSKIESSITLHAGTLSLQDGAILEADQLTVLEGATLEIKNTQTAAVAFAMADAATSGLMQSTLNADLYMQDNSVLKLTDATLNMNGNDLVLGDNVSFILSHNLMQQENVVLFSGVDELLDAEGNAVTSVKVNGVTTSVSADDQGNFVVDTFSINIPEPTTATLSLLALAGLAARRRRK